MGYFFERVSRAFSFIWAAVVMAFRDKDLLIPSAMSLVVTLGYVAAVLAALYATDNMWLVGIEKGDIEKLHAAATTERKSFQEQWEEKIAEVQAGAQTAEAENVGDPNTAAAQPAPAEPVRAAAPEEESRTRKYVGWAFMAAFAFGGYLITYFFTAMTISLVYDHLSGNDARIGQAFAVVMKRAPSIAMLAVVATGVSILSSLLRGKKNEDTLASSAVDKAWTVGSFLILPSIVIEDFSVWKGVKRAKEILAKNLLVVAVGEIAVSAVANFLGFVGVVTGVVAGFYVYRAMPQPLYIPIGAGGVICVAAMAFAGYVKVAYYTCLYVNAVESARMRKRAELPGPLAAALS